MKDTFVDKELVKAKQHIKDMKKLKKLMKQREKLEKIIYRPPVRSVFEYWVESLLLFFIEMIVKGKKKEKV